MTILLLTLLLQDPALDLPRLRPFFQKHCADCHLDGAAKGNLDLDVLPAGLADAETLRRWVVLHDRIRAGEMPPPKKAQIPAAEREAFLKSLDGPLQRADLARRKVVLRRLNRIEYENSVRELLGVHVDLRDLLPEDASLHGFDTLGEALAASSELVHAYLEAADLALDAAYGPEKEPKKVSLRFPLRKDAEQHIPKIFKDSPEGIVLFHTGYSPSVARSFSVKDPGSYRIRIHAKAWQSERPQILQVHAGDVLVRQRPFHLVGHFDIPSDRMIVVEFVDRFHRYDMVHPRAFKPVAHVDGKDPLPDAGVIVGDIEAEGPLEAWPPPSRAAILGGADPKSGTLEDARRVLAQLLPRAFRRPQPPEAVEPFLALVKTRLDAKRPYWESLRVGIQGVLTSPEFLFRKEPVAAGGGIDDPALATRLSYFLWSTMPDVELAAAAARGELRDPTKLRVQTERMLTDPKAEAFVRNFTGQWLDLRDIDFTEPDRKLYPEFDELLKASMLAETEGSFREILKGDRSLLEFIDADWTLLNERLAQHYGIPGVEGQALRKVSLPKDSPRGGVLTQAAVLKVTANGTNSSPVVRGVWVLENILGRPSPPPPPGVPAVEPDIRGTTTLREQLDKHRNVPSCAGCHAKIDPPGFALENFDVIGGWRERYRSVGAGDRLDRYIDPHARVRIQYKLGPPVDARGELAGGAAFRGIREFKKLLLEDKAGLAGALTAKLLTYSLGRGMGYSDRAEIARIVEAVKPRTYGFRSLVHEVVQSGLFRRP